MTKIRHILFHPRFDATPNREDIEVSERLIEAGNIVGIACLDHVIIEEDHYVSMKRLLDALSDIDVVSLFCDEAHIPFYQENGFKFSKSQHVMHMKKK